MGNKAKTLTDKQLIELEALASVLTQEQIADRFGICRTTFNQMRKRDPEIDAHYKRGKAFAIEEVAGSLMAKIRDGDTASIIFFLKTQAGWRETTRLEHTGKDGGPIEMQEVSARERIASQLARLSAAGNTYGDPQSIH